MRKGIVVKRLPTVCGLSLPAVVPWVWGELHLVGKQKDDMRYYLYRREAVQGKWCVLRVSDKKVICTCQTLHGGYEVCDELNALASGLMGVG